MCMKEYQLVGNLTTIYQLAVIANVTLEWVLGSNLGKVVFLPGRDTVYCSTRLLMDIPEEKSCHFPASSEQSKATMWVRPESYYAHIRFLKIQKMWQFFLSSAP